MSSNHFRFVRLSTIAGAIALGAAAAPAQTIVNPEQVPYPVEPGERVVLTNEPKPVLRAEQQQATRSRPRALAEHELMLAVETALRRDDAVPANNIDVQINGGVVTLSGVADNLMVRERAERVAQNVRGVLAVTNEIEVRRSESADEQLQRDIAQALGTDPATRQYEVNAAVNEGKVILTGNVQNQYERALAEDIVMAVAGVRNIQNNVAVSRHTERTDEEIFQDVMDNLQISQVIDAQSLSVNVRNGVVEIAGTAPSAFAKQRVHELAHVPGTREVIVSDLAVQWWDEERRQSMSTADFDLNDTAVRELILRKLSQNPRIAPFQVDVNVQDGVAYVTGVVDNLAARLSASEAARTTPGVYRVHNLLKVRPGQPADDQVIREYLITKSSNDFYLGNDMIDVSVSNGVVTLDGAVDSRFERDYAQQLASRVQGVTSVRNHLQVERAMIEMDDWELRQEVESALYWNPLIDAENIKVDVDRGVVTLSGWTNEWSDRTMAVDTAYQTGATTVYNLIRVPNSPLDDRQQREYSAQRDSAR